MSGEGSDEFSAGDIRDCMWTMIEYASLCGDTNYFCHSNKVYNFENCIQIKISAENFQKPEVNPEKPIGQEL